MKFVLLEEAIKQGVFINSIQHVRDLYQITGYPELDERFELEFKCELTYDRTGSVSGFVWRNDADFSWFLLRCSV